MSHLVSTEHYPIFIGKGLWKELAEYLEMKPYSSYYILVDENTKEFCLPLLLKGCKLLKKAHVIEVASGEVNKNLESCSVIWREMTEANADRSALFLNLGGGVIGDMGGFASSTFKRGVDFMNIPTTLLSQVDSSVGGKLGIDFNGYKNHIGLFRFPEAVFIDPIFLKTLDFNQKRSGFAEILKHALISDKEYWKEVSALENLDAMDWESIILRSVEIKKEIVQSDPFEKGRRKALNFGHTIGHAIETYFLESKSALLHGEAIAIGMIMEAYLACVNSYLSKKELEQIQSTILRCFGKFDIEFMDRKLFWKYIHQDKKNQGNKVSFTLLQGIGSVRIDQFLPDKQIENALDYYIEL